MTLTLQQEDTEKVNSFAKGCGYRVEAMAELWRSASPHAFGKGDPDEFDMWPLGTAGTARCQSLLDVLADSVPREI